MPNEPSRRLRALLTHDRAGATGLTVGIRRGRRRLPCGFGLSKAQYSKQIRVMNPPTRTLDVTLDRTRDCPPRQRLRTRAKSLVRRGARPRHYTWPSRAPRPPRAPTRLPTQMPCSMRRSQAARKWIPPYGREIAASWAASKNDPNRARGEPSAFVRPSERA
jgi:hypothetical protein